MIVVKTTVYNAIDTGFGFAIYFSLLVLRILSECTLLCIIVMFLWINSGSNYSRINLHSTHCALLITSYTSILNSILEVETNTST